MVIGAVVICDSLPQLSESFARGLDRVLGEELGANLHLILNFMGRIVSPSHRVEEIVPLFRAGVVVRAPKLMKIRESRVTALGTLRLRLCPATTWL